MRWHLIAVALMMTCVAACRYNLVTEAEPLPVNPYDTLQYDDGAVAHVPIDSNSFLGIHQYVLSVKCAQPACHDGTFEPDFRTVNSSYNSLVLAKVAKHTPDSAFAHRVVPFDTAKSWLHERITTDDALLGRMPLYDVLPQRQIDLIANWILDGAKDLSGYTPGFPDPQPYAYPFPVGIAAFLTSNNMRVDTFRGSSILNPFLVPANSSVKIWFGLLDGLDFNPDITAADFNHTVPLVYNGLHKVKFSSDPMNFDNAPLVPLFNDGAPLNVVINGSDVPYFLNVTVNTSQYNPGDVVYMRVYAQDAAHSEATEIPANASPFYYKTNFAFVVQ